MKLILFILFMTTLGSNYQNKQNNSTIHPNTTNQISINNRTDKSKYYTTKDTLLIVTEIDDTLKFEKEEFNHIVDNHPELYRDIPEGPDQVYYCNENEEDFGSQAGQDSYYVLYAYFLKQKNGTDTYKEVRKKLIDIYTNINSLFQQLQYGGTYFGHQYYRILGYAEYSVYLYSKSKDNFEKTYNITKQKELYMKSFRQLIEDESKIDYQTLRKDKKIERSKRLNEIVDELNKLITDNFYLRRAQEFHYEHYEYY